MSFDISSLVAKTTLQISRGKFSYFLCTLAGFTAVPFDDSGLRDQLPARPSTTALYPIPVRQVADLLDASFRLCLATQPLRFATLHRHQVVEGLSPPVIEHARHTTKKRGR